MNNGFSIDCIGYAMFAVFVLLVMPWMVDYSGYELNTYARYLALGMAAAALALSWGTAGLLNLGQALTFGIGAYIMAMHLKLKASASQAGGLPDFMVWTNMEELPWFWEPFHSVGITLAAGVLVPVGIAGLIGGFMFRGRITGVFVAIITLSLMLAVQLWMIAEQQFTGGQNGLTGLASLELFGWSVDIYTVAFYYLVAGCLMVILALALLLVRSKAGLVLKAIKADPERVRFFGYDVARYEVLAFSTSAGIAGVAGMFYAMVLEFASPTYMGLSLSLAFVIWAAVGGRESIVAATLGGIGVNMAEGRLSDLFFDQWTLILGVIFIVVVLFLPRGLFGLVMDFREKLEDFYRNKTKASTASDMESNPVSAIDQGGDK
ncbi:Urea ABC transporter, permease protein UrtC [Marinobacter salarius]|uniref:urea ABC transporter permease subunit UrtC n=1 Tax=Marinobacter salarius TaxID=1420917 RepID=UPI00125A61FC|nr:urea ABC transporter permease subunit UrtC [Marinobacter salarius]VVT14633.1 Urea ABC transporter permease subunit UrtC [Marinobacter salarius]VXB34609.1 Urea ABC transporter, permease protein UrtC [Marinobacter salarius]